MILIINLKLVKSYFACLMKISIFLLTSLLVVSCNSSRITSSWRTPDVKPVVHKKILVLALSQPDNNLKQLMEQHLVDDLKSHNVDAISAYTQYGPKAFDDLNEKEVLEKIKNTGTDAVITIVLLDKSKERSYVRGHIYYTPYAMYYNRFWGYYNTLHTRVYAPGYYVTNTEYFWESNLYDVSSGELVYSVQTKSFNPDNSTALAHAYGQLIIHDMIKNGVVATPSQEIKN